MDQTSKIERPVYRHIIVKRRGIIEKVASPEDLQRLRRQMDAGEAVDPTLQHLVVKDTTRKTIQETLRLSKREGLRVEAAEEGIAAEDVIAEYDIISKPSESTPLSREPIKYQAQSGMIVSRLTQQHIPGGNERLPLQLTKLTHPGFDQAVDPEVRYLECAEELQKRFQAHSDQKFLLMGPEMRKSVTLVTVCLMPITAAPRAHKGLELFCEFHQTTRFGHVDTEGFEVYSEVGLYPHTPPNRTEMTLIMKSADETVASRPQG